MKVILRESVISVVMTAALALIVCGVYPVAVFACSHGLFPGKANGSILYQNGAAIGSELLGQQFTVARYFHPRPSCAGSGYDAMASCGSNLGPTSRDLIGQIKERVEKFRQENNLSADTPVSVDAVTASGSGLDPHISVLNALAQASRVAHARGLDKQAVVEAIRGHTEGRTFGILGEPRVNVLKLNLWLDAKYGARK